LSTNTMTATQTCRLLYYGPAGAGKRENLKLINRSLPPQHRLSLASADPERQIAFRLKTEKDGEWQVLVQAVDAGLEKHPSAGMETSPPFDGIIFVVSSRAPHLDYSLAALEGLKGYLDSWGLDLMTVPVVIQYNGRDAADMLPVDRLESLINPWGLISFPASSDRDEGIRETLKSILGLTINHLSRSMRSTMNVEVISSSPKSGLNHQVPAESLGLEYGPPLPGVEIEQKTIERSNAIFDELSPPVVVPVTIPRRLLDGEGPVRILLEVEITD
jgi:mutual gliding-motility protein MglA